MKQNNALKAPRRHLAGLVAFVALTCSAQTDDTLLVMLDLQYEAITQKSHDPWVNACIAERLSPRWLLPTTDGILVGEVVQDQVLIAAQSCSEQFAKKRKVQATQKDVGERAVGEAVSSVLLENVQARKRLAQKKEAFRKCLESSKDKSRANDCLSREDLMPATSEQKMKVQTLITHWNR